MADAVSVPVQRKGSDKKEIVKVTQKPEAGGVEKVKETSSDPDLPTGEDSAQATVEDGVKYVRGHPVIRNG